VKRTIFALSLIMRSPQSLNKMEMPRLKRGPPMERQALKEGRTALRATIRGL
jgi:hypothetical protein